MKGVKKVKEKKQVEEKKEVDKVEVRWDKELPVKTILASSLIRTSLR